MCEGTELERREQLAGSGVPRADEGWCGRASCTGLSPQAHSGAGDVLPAATVALHLLGGSGALSV